VSKPKAILTIGEKEYDFDPAPVGVMMSSQLRGKADVITNMDAAKWVLKSLSDEDREEVIRGFEDGSLDWNHFTEVTVPDAMELLNTRPTS